MKKTLAFTACIFVFGASFAQNRTAATQNNPAGDQRKLAASGKCAISGTIKNERNQPISDVQLFIYQADSSIVASGYTNAAGAYETNSVLKGKYDVKVVYPSSKTLLITGVMMKPGLTEISLKAAAPEADTTMPYTDIMPKPAEKGKHGAKPGTTTTTTTTTTKVTTTTTKVAPVAAKKN
jgi:Carboxypeptidase regulatory-like domain